MNVTYFAICVAVATAPGPEVMTVLHHSLNHGLLRSLPLILGMQVGLAIVALIAGSSVGMLIPLAPVLPQWFGVIGGGYLCYLGVTLLQASDATSPRSSLIDHETDRLGFVQGVLVASANPKTLIFFVAVVPAFLERTPFSWVQLSLLAGTFMLVTLIVRVGYGYEAAAVSRYLTRHARWVKPTAGALFILAGLYVMAGSVLI